MNNNPNQFKKQKYINLETFRKNGEGVKTPVWFAEDGETLRIWTEGGSGKVKRIRRDGKVRITPSTADGRSLGEWLETNAIVFESPEEIQHTKDLFLKKYGWMFKMFALLGKVRRGRFVTLEIKLNSSPAN
ncbi:PPOX class F420-dependent oxidoreductase [Chloroflexota bacterium]